MRLPGPGLGLGPQLFADAALLTKPEVDWRLGKHGGKQQVMVNAQMVGLG